MACYLLFYLCFVFFSVIVERSHVLAGELHRGHEEVVIVPEMIDVRFFAVVVKLDQGCANQGEGRTNESERIKAYQNESKFETKLFFTFATKALWVSIKRILCG